MTRKNFPKSVMLACIKRASRGDVAFCELCGAMAKRFQVDHIDPDALTGQPTLENAQLACIPCHKEKTALDVAAIAKAKRREAVHLGATRPAAKINSPGFAPSSKPKREPKPDYTTRRALFVDRRTA